MNRYTGMDEYIADKTAIFLEMEKAGYAVFNADDPYQEEFPGQTRARSLFFSEKPLRRGVEGAFLEEEIGVLRLAGEEVEVLPASLELRGQHNRLNLLAAALALSLFGISPSAVKTALSGFKGLPHRLELVAESRGLRFYNDSAATIPQATMEALKSVPRPICLIMGGTDKNIDFTPLRDALELPAEIFLLTGSATKKIVSLLDNLGHPYHGPFDTLEDALDSAIKSASAGTSILFSPGCTSFEMFLNEFDRGDRFKELVLANSEA
jgi:UDP-N-acetylmuramoylalanine--D-glutamate ligase